MKFAVGIPTLNRWDVLQPSLLMYVKDFADTTIYIVDNGKQGIGEYASKFKNVIVIENDTNIGVGASWNQLCDEIFKENEYALILNDDIYMGKKSSDIVGIIKKNNNIFNTATPDWCAFIMPKTIYNKVGKFDECFYPAYYEDNSYAYRMKLNRVVHLKTPLLNPSIYRSSMSLEKDYSILDARKKNLQLYIKMWGGEPKKEIFTKPYNN